MIEQKNKKILKKNIILTAGLVITFIGLSLFFITPELKAVQDQSADKEKEQKIVVKEISGQVSGISNNFISVVYKSDTEKGTSYEIAFMIDSESKKELKIKNKKTLNEISSGDLIKIKYEEISEEVERMRKDGKMHKVPKIVGKRVKVITFLRPKASDSSSGR